MSSRDNNDNLSSSGDSRHDNVDNHDGDDGAERSAQMPEESINQVTMDNPTGVSEAIGDNLDSSEVLDSSKPPQNQHANSNVREIVRQQASPKAESNRGDASQVDGTVATSSAPHQVAPLPEKSSAGNEALVETEVAPDVEEGIKQQPREIRRNRVARKSNANRVVATTTPPREVDGNASNDNSRKRVKRGNLPILALAIVVVVTVVIAVALMLNKGDPDQYSAIGTPTPTQSPTWSAYQPPSPNDCTNIANGLPVDGQQDLFFLDVNLWALFTLQVEGNASSIDLEPFFPNMTASLQKSLVPAVLGCGKLDEDPGYVIGNAKIGNIQERNRFPCYPDPDLCVTIDLSVEFTDVYLKRNILVYNGVMQQIGNGVFEISTGVFESDLRQSFGLEEASFVQQIIGGGTQWGPR